eukprot:1150895-Pelagomonas_calceolata.AAC.2
MGGTSPQCSCKRRSSSPYSMGLSMDGWSSLHCMSPQCSVHTMRRSIVLHETSDLNCDTAQAPMSLHTCLRHASFKLVVLHEPTVSLCISKVHCMSCYTTNGQRTPAAAALFPCSTLSKAVHMIMRHIKARCILNGACFGIGPNPTGDWPPPCSLRQHDRGRMQALKAIGQNELAANCVVA